jgi:hypothetical protein
MEHFDDRVLFAFSKTFNVSFTPAPVLMSLLNSLSFSLREFLDLINSLHDFLSLENPANSPPFQDSVELVLDTSDLLHSLKTFAGHVTSEKLLDFASRVVDQLLNKHCLMVLHKLERITHPVNKVMHQNFLLDTFAKLIKFELSIHSSPDKLPSEMFLDKGRSRPLLVDSSPWVDDHWCIKVLLSVVPVHGLVAAGLLFVLAVQIAH